MPLFSLMKNPPPAFPNSTYDLPKRQRFDVLVVPGEGNWIIER
ncbi:hypothetical protein THTE_0013 [Thermogutta terrifontis]|uniref:Uncharacterized protein n=1 Tax=Thermogutta terrifontis TaxID=1331910 RepID=A0A286R9I0_9BACT|nr:hypothetical protein THTE_0013 [Thermogutta terrifontis]